MGDIKPNKVADPEARAALVWILGQFGKHLESKQPCALGGLLLYYSPVAVVRAALPVDSAQPCHLSQCCFQGVWVQLHQKKPAVQLCTSATAL